MSGSEAIQTEIDDGLAATGVVAAALGAAVAVVVVVEVVVVVSVFLPHTVRERRIATERRATIANFSILF